jgi:hypothetical protein
MLLRAAVANFSVGETGVPWFDQGALAVNLRDKVPTWETIMLVYSRPVPSEHDPTAVWAGLVSLDAEGFVVWYTQYAGDVDSDVLTISPFVQLGALDGYSVAYGVWFGGADGFPTYETIGGQNVYSELIKVSAYGDVEVTTTTTCSSDMDDATGSGLLSLKQVGGSSESQRESLSGDEPPAVRAETSVPARSSRAEIRRTRESRAPRRADSRARSASRPARSRRPSLFRRASYAGRWRGRVSHQNVVPLHNLEEQTRRASSRCTRCGSSRRSRRRTTRSCS